MDGEPNIFGVIPTDPLLDIKQAAAITHRSVGSLRHRFWYANVKSADQDGPRKLYRYSDVVQHVDRAVDGVAE